MGFVKVNNNEFEIIITEEGLKAMLTEGLLSKIEYFGLGDDNVIYTLNTEKQPIPDITGSRNNYTMIKFKQRKPLKNG
jgi:hypothetical protein